MAAHVAAVTDTMPGSSAIAPDCGGAVPGFLSRTHHWGGGGVPAGAEVDLRLQTSRQPVVALTV